MELLNERWVPVAGYEGFYEVSDRGRIKSLKRYRRGKSGCMVPIPEKIMKLCPKKRSASGRTLPYMEVKMRCGQARTEPHKSFLVHRLVAQAFIGELFEGSHVDHVDGDHQNNHCSNLRILSAREHGKLHPCMVNKLKNAEMQASAQAKIVSLRADGKIVGRCNVAKNTSSKTANDPNSRINKSLRAWNC
jgi:hypothetical protein